MAVYKVILMKLQAPTVNLEITLNLPISML